MRAAAILGLGSSTKELKPFQKNSDATWLIGLPASSTEADAILIFGGDGPVSTKNKNRVSFGRARGQADKPGRVRVFLEGFQLFGGGPQPEDGGSSHAAGNLTTKDT